MGFLWKYGWPVGLAIGLLVGLTMGGLWPDTPLDAVATDRADNFAIATGPVNDETEAVYYLDFLTGTLRAAVLSKRQAGFQAIYETNIQADLQAVINQASVARARAGAAPLTPLQMPQTPNYLMVTGATDIQRVPGQRLRPSRSVLYVAETNTGIVLAYMIPWSEEMHNADQKFAGVLTLWAGDRFGSAFLRPE